MLISKLAKVSMVFVVLGSLLISGCSLSSSSSVKLPSNPEQTGKLNAMNDTADQMYRLTKEGRYTEARDRLEQFAKQMTNVTYQDITTAEGLNALTELVSDSRKVFNQVRFSPEQGLLAAAKLRLAADSLAHKEQPMWLQYRKVFKEDAMLLRGALKEKNDIKSVQSLQNFHRHYLLIRPAVRMTRDAALVEKLDSWFIFMHGLLTQEKIDYAKAGTGALHTDDLIAELFDGGEKATIGVPNSDNQPILWAAVLAAAIVSVLAHVGWQKYKYMGG